LLLGFIGILFLLLVIGALFAPKLIEMEAVNEYLEEQLSQEIDGHVDFRRINLSWFPRPHAVVQDVTFSLSADVDGKMTALRIYPKIVPLIWGGFELSRLSAIEPEYNLKISKTLTPDAHGQQDLAISDALEDLHDLLLAFPGFTVSGLNVKIKDGSVRIFDGDQRVFGFHDLQASYSRPENETKFDLTCKSNLWNDISINGRLDTEKFSGHGTIRFAEFRSHALSNYFFPDSPLKITEALANLAIDFELNGPAWFRANLNGSFPYIKITNERSKLEFRNSLINGTVRVTESETSFSIEKLSMLQPRINLAGKLRFDQQKPLVTLDLEGRDFEIESIRRLAQETGGKNKILQTVLNVVRGGDVPKVTLSSKGKQLEDLIKMKNILLRGEMVDSNIYVPEINLDLKQVAGTVVILDGLLQGYNLKAQMGGSLGKNGRLTLGLNKHISPFHLDILIHADLTQLPPILKRVVKDENFLNELARIKTVNGEALGRLTIDYDKKKIGVKVEASEVQIEADYERIPFPVKISGGPFYFDLRQVGFSNFDVAVGKSTFGHVASTLKWQKSTRLTFASETASVHMDEIFPWLKSIGAIPRDLQDIRSVEGLIHIDRVSLAGPLLHPEKWKIQSRGKFEQVSIQSKKLFKPLRIARGQFASQDTRFGINDVDASVGESSLSDITGGIDWGDTNALTIASGSSSLNVKELYDWLIELDNIREYIRKIPPINGTLALKSLKLDTPLQSPKIQQIRFSAEFNPSNLNSKHFPGQLQIDRGKISLAQERLLLADCNGGFGKSTFSQLAIDWDWGTARSLKANSQSVVMSADEIWPWLSRLRDPDTEPGAITVTDGRAVLTNLEIVVPLNRIERWRISASGDLHDITAMAEFMDHPLTLVSGKFILSQGDLAGVSHNVVNLESARIIWGESQILLIGDIYLAPDKPFIDMNISMNSMKWARIEKIIDYSSDPKGESKKPSEPFITAELRISADIFEYGNFTFQPLQTNVSLRAEEIMVTIEKADLCDITINGFIKITDQGTEYYIIPAARDKALEKTLACLSKEKASASGVYNLGGEVMSKATPQAPARMYSGELDFNAREGRIYRFGLLAKVFAVLNVTEIYRGEAPDLLGKGFAYKSMTIKANFEGKKLVMEECTIDGASMGIACDGEIDLAEDKINLVILVAPFKTVDRIVKKIPLVSSVLGGKLVSIPFRAIGDLDDPAVIPLEPTAVGSGVLGVLERTLKLPITMMQPLMDDEKEDKAKVKNDQEVIQDPVTP
jgi:hypothetical protein